jgi:hypothetical protein
MIRTVALAGLLLGPVLLAHGADEAKGEKVESTTYSDYFVKNNSGVKDDAAYLVFTNQESYDKVFTLRPPLMGKKSVAMPNDVFEKNLVIAAIKRGNAITTYTIDKVTVDGDTLFIQYKAATGKASTATFASPLIVSAEKGKVKKVAFIENEKTVATVDVK